MGKVDITKLTSKIKRTKVWKNAESEYSFFYADEMLPPQFRLGEPITNEEVIDKMQFIIDSCPAFYPAYFDMGVRLLSVNIDLAVETLDTAFKICVKINSWDTISNVYNIFFDNLEKTFHEELIVRYALKLIGIFPDKAILYDFVAQGFNTLGEHNKSIEYGMNAISIEPQNTYFLNNLGISYLADNRFDDAEKYFNLSIEADRNHNYPKNNLISCKIMKEKGLSLKEYYLMRTDYKKIENYANNEEWEKLDEYVKFMNHQKLHALHVTLSQKYQFKVQNFHLLFSTLITFFDFVKSVSNETFVWEDVDYVCRYFKPIMHKFIFKHGDVDDKILNEVFDSTLIYYRFLFDNMVITQKQFAAFKELISSLKDELFDKMYQYNKIRHNPDVSEKRKEIIREKLFEDDHVWPFIN